MYHTRLIRILLSMILFVAAILCYGLFAMYFGGIPCMFYKITGYKCPGCGMTRVIISLMHGDILGAIRQNIAVFLMLPIGVWFILLRISRFLKYGSTKITTLENVLLWGMVVLLLCFGIIRNIIGL